MTNLEKITEIDFIATLMHKQDIDDLVDKSCRSMQEKHNGECPSGEDGPEDSSKCMDCYKTWLQEEAVD